MAKNDPENVQVWNDGIAHAQCPICGSALHGKVVKGVVELPDCDDAACLEARAKNAEQAKLTGLA